MHFISISSARPLLGAAGLVFSIVAQASTTLDAIGAGWFTNAGEHVESNTNYAVGGGMDGYTRNNYFLFDVSGLGNQITAATLRVYNPDMPLSPGAPFGYTSSDPTENYALFDVSTDFYSAPTGGTNHVAGYAIGSSTGQAIFNDLGTGQSYGSHTASLADNGRFIEISLNASGLADLNASGGIFAIGGSITTLDNLVNMESLFASAYLYTSTGAVQLVVSSVPEPSESVLLLAGLGLVVVASRRKPNPKDQVL
ncbi:MAG: PEP-CTERM sorting domain-containing protein [Hydrogenophilales bacterium]|nr:PEP-CTERM sorting domain-containing protein [Hydrogenophilales bacterium]